MTPALAHDSKTRQSEQPTRKELLNQLERIVSSSHFRNSKRYPSFLRFVVERTVDENTEVLKERNLGTEVFGRPSDYDTNADPIVRVTAGEVRKRIAQYYQTAGHEDELRIDLPLGSYVPHFYPSSHPPTSPAKTVDHDPTNEIESMAPLPPATDEEIPLPVLRAVAALPTDLKSRKVITRRQWRLGLYTLASLGVVVAALIALNTVRVRALTAGTDYFWQAYTPASTNALIVMGVHFMDSTGKNLPTNADGAPLRNGKESVLSAMESEDMVPLSDVVSYSKLTDTLTRRSLAYRTGSSATTTLDELRHGPVILIGGFDNIWTLRLTSSLRFRFSPKNENVNQIQDSEHPSTVWAYDNLQPLRGTAPDYAIVASYFDKTIEQHVLLAAGIGKSGTMAATEFLTTEKYMKNWLSEAKVPSGKNIELVLSTDVLDGEAGPPHVIAYSVW